EVWSGTGRYEAIHLEFLESIAKARRAHGFDGGVRVRNVVATWDRDARPSRSFRRIGFDCLRDHASGTPTKRQPPPATLATFAGAWAGHTRGLSIKPDGVGHEYADAGCCYHDYRLTFRILSANGTVTKASAVYRVMSFRRYFPGV